LSLLYPVTGLVGKGIRFNYLSPFIFFFQVFNV
jgi:hypothetical protein